MSGERWQFAIDTGGSFTDCIAVDPSGATHSCKVLSNSALRARITRKLSSRILIVDAPPTLPEAFFRGFRLGRLGDATEVLVQDSTQRGRLSLAEPVPPTWEEGDAIELRSPEEAPLLAARLITGTPAQRRLPPLDIRLATTRGTNALLTRSGAPTAHFITAGFADLLEIGTQQRPELFAQRIRKPASLVSRTVEVTERIDADGSVRTPLDLAPVPSVAQELLEAGIDCAAVSLLHSAINPQHELELAQTLLDAGFHQVSISSELAARTGILARAQTCAVDATLSPVIDDYVRSIRTGLGAESSSLHLMTSAGGLVRSQDFRAKDSLLSGPAGGVVGAAAWSRAAGEPQIVAFDMGGTSTDVSRWGGDFTYDFEHTVNDATLLAPALTIHTVAAGGGSICHVQRGRLRVGPQSAGAVPGPACYGMGGPLTLSDVNLLLGRLQPERFPIPISEDAARAALVKVRRQLATPELTDEEILEGFLQIANERMADAIGEVSLRRGYDPAEHALVAFGGAAGQHACSVASMLGMTRVLIPPRASLLSAAGLAHAAVERIAEKQLLLPLEPSLAVVESTLATLEHEAHAQLTDEGFAPNQIKTARTLAELRFLGQDSTLSVDVYGARALPHSFRRAYRELFGHVPRDLEIEVVSLRVVARGPAPRLPESGDRLVPPHTARRNAFHAGAWHETEVVSRDALVDGKDGPTLVEDESTVVVVPPGWHADLHPSGMIRLTAHAPIDTAEVRPWAIQRELFAHRLESMAREMGELLRRTAISTNVKERLDFSCAVLDPDGYLVVNAPHIPVHLGAMGVCVRETERVLPLAEGDVAVTNHPGFGGSHLPDITVMMPVDVDGQRVGYVAARAHHAELGGISPGSMPAAGRRLTDEGVVIPPTHLVRGGQPEWERITQILTGGPHPSRNVETNLADLRAMVAACRRGADALAELAQRQGAASIQRAMTDLKQMAASHLEDLLSTLPGRERTAQERLDDGSVLQVSISVDGGKVVIDFAGTSPRHPGNLNATPAIVRSAVLYVLRLLLREDIPLNEGLLDAVDLRIPPCLLNPGFDADPHASPAVVGGNVETSQRLVDTLLKAFGGLGCAQGTMNNVTFGNDSFGYYETIGGGAGAGPDFAGAHCVHTHMTNTRITDVEILEHRYPVRVLRFGRRRGSGGRGHFAGGDGVVRELEFTGPAELSWLCQHRVEAPYGVDGGQPGTIGTQTLQRADGSVEDLDGVGSTRVQPGDRFRIETPGGGGFGKAQAEA